MVYHSKERALTVKKEKWECIKTSMNWKPFFINHHRLHWIWKSPVIDGLQMEFRDKIRALVVSGFVMIWNEAHVWCHNHENKDKYGSSTRRTSHKPLVMDNSSYFSMHTTTCTPTWLHGGWETQWPHCVWLHTVLSLQAQTHHFIIVQIFVNFFPYCHFHWNRIDNTVSIQKHPQTANCKKISKIFCN